ncbi:MAG: hypothetical protein C0617_13850 [Desulfuromonas sp.]|uniref:YbaK/EbsC family protein n=1 Tax=Desulfuromonas sp. TaxID=892 RepID=UPI000CC21A62|nr:YbaK/EbsC family protein [Desulfuromonas sp.]PLX82599.1 MAG: hypothetical protein C0617_13850 [Desulfuromonas sp.]
MPTFDDVRRHLCERGIPVRHFEQSTPNAEMAARAVGCSVAEIAKSMLLFVGGHPCLVVTSGDAKVRSSQLKKAVGRKGKVLFPAADEVYELTGYVPGGVCPFLLPEGLEILLDTSLRRFTTVYPAAGDDHSAAAISFEMLLDLTGGREVAVCGIAQDAGPTIQM